MRTDGSCMYNYLTNLRIYPAGNWRYSLKIYIFISSENLHDLQTIPVFLLLSLLDKASK